jgi:hypothetical protein
MAYSKVRWFSTPAFLACVGGTHDRGEGMNVRKEERTAEGGGAHGSTEGAHGRGLAWLQGVGAWRAGMS